MGEIVDLWDKLKRYMTRTQYETILSEATNDVGWFGKSGFGASNTLSKKNPGVKPVSMTKERIKIVRR